MKKKTNIKTIIRKIVREEVAMAIEEVLLELRKPTVIPQQRQVTEAIGKEVNFSNNSVLNEVLNETAASKEWKTMGGGTYDSSKMNDVLQSSYGNMMGDNQSGVVVNGKTGDEPGLEFLKKDYRSILKKSEEKSRQKRGM